MCDKHRPATFRLSVTSIDLDDNTIVEGIETGLLVYLCPNCSATHVEIQMPEAGAVFGFKLSPEGAEAIARALINPPPVQMGDIEVKSGNSKLN